MSSRGEPSRCRDCGAKVLWARSETGKRIPVDTEPRADGDLMLVTTENGKLLALAGRWLYEQRADGFSRQSYYGYGYDGRGTEHFGRYVAHRATCTASEERSRP